MDINQLKACIDNKIAVKVFLSPRSQYSHQISSSIMGEIEYHSEKEWFGVLFENGYSNNYQIQDLILVGDSNETLCNDVWITILADIE